MSKILVLTEFSLSGSGYHYLMSPLMDSLAQSGHEVRVIGLSYDGSEHNYKFSVCAAQSVSDSVAIAANIIKLWSPDLFICGLDIPLQLSIFPQIKEYGVKYLAITPLENPPLAQTWAAGLMAMNWVFFISELGKQAGITAGLQKVGHIQVGADTKTYRVPTSDERESLRKDLGFTDNFVILTVADNQERKNLWAEFEIVSNLKKAGKKVKLVLVTREHSPVGHKLRDLAMDYDINKELTVIERGIKVEDLWKLYAASDIYLSCSKAEGLGLPVLDAMSSGLEVVATNTGALTELLSDGRGHLISSEYKFRDVWGNSWRSMINTSEASAIITNIMEDKSSNRSVVTKAREYVEGRTFDIPSKQLLEKVEEIING